MNIQSKANLANEAEATKRRRGYKSKVSVSGNHQKSVKNFKELQRSSPSRNVQSPTRGTNQAVNPLSQQHTRQSSPFRQQSFQTEPSNKTGMAPQVPRPIVKNSQPSSGYSTNNLNTLVYDSAKTNR